MTPDYTRLAHEYMTLNEPPQARSFLKTMELCKAEHVPMGWRNKDASEVVLIAKEVFDLIVSNEIKRRGMLI